MNMTSLKRDIENGAWWVYVGGSRGAGKTTLSCALAVQIAKRRRHKVLLISRKSPHNISDIFEQKFSNEPTKVEGVVNLYAMELDSKPPRRMLRRRVINVRRISERIGKRLFDSFHNYDQNINFAKINKFLIDKQICIIVWDTAASIDNFGIWPFGQQPKQALEADLRAQCAPKFDGSLLDHFSYDKCCNEILRKLDSMKKKYPQWRYPSENAFVLVDTIHPLHTLGNKILIRCLAQHDVNTHLVVNRLTSEGATPYDVGDQNFIYEKKSKKRRECYLVFPVTKLPLKEKKVRGVAGIKSFSKYLIKPFFKESKDDDDDDDDYYCDDDDDDEEEE